MKKKSQSLLSKYFSICVALILVSIIFLGLILLLFASQYFKEDKYGLLERNAEQAANITSFDIATGKTSYFIDVKLTLSSYKILGNAIGADMFLVDNSGNTIICTNSESAHYLQHLVDKDILSEVSQGSYKNLGTLSGIYDKAHYIVGIPVKSTDGIVIGSVFACADASGLTQFLAEITKMFLLSSVAVLAISFVIIYFTTDRLVTPLKEMVKATESFSRGDFTVRVHVEGNDEIDKLAMSFNEMASSLATLESTRRMFIANVSHELKTPMTTIGGFVDGILDGTIPPEKQNHYLKIVSDEVKRLSRLVRSMLNIARIEAGEMTTTVTEFDINNLVCQTVFTFEQKIEEKGLDIIGLDSGRVMVEGDCDLIHSNNRIGEIEGTSILVILLVASADLISGVLQGVLGQFVLQRLGQVDAGDLGEPEHEVERVRQLLGDIGPAALRAHLRGLFLGLEPEKLQQLPGLGRYADGQVLGVVELRPIAFLAEIAGETLEVLYRAV